MANSVYNYFKKALLVGSINLGVSGSVGGTTAPLYMALVSASYTPNVDTHQYLSSVTSIVTPSNYSAYILVSSPSVVLDTGANAGILYASNLLLANVTFGTAVIAGVLFCSTPLGPTGDPLVAYIDFVTAQSVTAGSFQIFWAAGGVLATT